MYISKTYFSFYYYCLPLNWLWVHKAIAVSSVKPSAPLSYPVHGSKKMPFLCAPGGDPPTAPTKTSRGKQPMTHAVKVKCKMTALAGILLPQQLGAH